MARRQETEQLDRQRADAPPAARGGAASPGDPARPAPEGEPDPRRAHHRARRPREEARRLPRPPLRPFAGGSRRHAHAAVPRRARLAARGEGDGGVRLDPRPPLPHPGAAQRRRPRGGHGRAGEGVLPRQGALRRPLPGLWRDGHRAAPRAGVHALRRALHDAGGQGRMYPWATRWGSRRTSSTSRSAWRTGPKTP